MNRQTVSGDDSMMTKPCRLALRLIITILISAVLFACGKDGNPAQENNSAAIAFQLKWPVAKSVASAPAGVVTVRISVSAPDMTTMSKDFAASAGTGSIAGVPVGSNRTITFQGLDSNGFAIYQKNIPNVTLVQGQSYDCGPVSMDIVGVPVAPTALVATAISPTQINLVWVDNATYETGYKIERRTGISEPYVQIGIAAANATSYSDTTLSQLTSYSYRVRAVTNGIGESGYSNEANASTPVQTYSVSGTITSGGAALAAVAVNISGNATPATTDSAGFFSFSGVTNGSYTLTPVKAGFDFSPTASTVLVSGANPPALSFTATANSVPNDPTALSATPGSSNWIKLAWQDNANNENGYRIERALAAGGPYMEIVNLPANTTTYTDSSLLLATTYYYRVGAVNDFNGISYSAYSAEVQGTTSPVPPAYIEPELVKISSGTFTMGDTFGDGGSDELPLHRVTVGDFSIGKYEVTVREWSAIGKALDARNLYPDHPVVYVTWDDVQQFIAELNKKSGKNYRLPTEAEWEYAASVRTDGQKEKYSGGSDVAAVAWYGNAVGAAQPVGGKQPNSRGIYDMSGNVWEWVSDWYGAYDNSAQTNPIGPASGTVRVSRGGSWNSQGTTYERATFRAYFSPTYKQSNIGFRLAITNP